MLWLCSATLSKTVDHSAALHAAASCSHVLIDPVIVTWTATQSFKGGGHCACQRCESLYSICIPSVKLVGLPVLRIWQIFSHSVNWPGNLDLWPCDRSVNEVTGHLWYGLPANFQLPTPFCSWFRMRHVTDGQTDDGHQYLMPHSMGAGHNNIQKHL